MVEIHELTRDHTPSADTLLACHARAPRRGSWMTDPEHWDGFAGGTGRATTVNHRPNGARRRPPRRASTRRTRSRRCWPAITPPARPSAAAR
jgi:hypothetical protein